MQQRVAAFDEMMSDAGLTDAVGGIANAHPRAHYKAFAAWLAQQPDHVLNARREEAELIFRRVGITFAVYGDNDGTERTIPFDLSLIHI